MPESALQSLCKRRCDHWVSSRSSSGAGSAIAKIAEKHELAIVEDDTYGFLMEEHLPPIATMTKAYFITSLSKSVAPGLRIGYLVAPEADVGRLADAIWASTVMVSGLNAEIATRWIESGVSSSSANSSSVICWPTALDSSGNTSSDN